MQPGQKELQFAANWVNGGRLPSLAKLQLIQVAHKIQVTQHESYRATSQLLTSLKHISSQGPQLQL